jgi:hypothetical protein
VPWSVHTKGVVRGPHPGPCHGNIHFNADGTGRYTCSEGHVIPKQIEWQVEEPWSEERFERWADKDFEGDGPSQFRSEGEMVQAAIARFMGWLPTLSHEHEIPPREPGDRLFLGYKPYRPDEDVYPDGDGQLIATYTGDPMPGSNGNSKDRAKREELEARKKVTGAKKQAEGSKLKPRGGDGPKLTPRRKD